MGSRTLAAAALAAIAVVLAAAVAVAAPNPGRGTTRAGATDPAARADRDWKPHVAAARRFARSRKGETRFAIVDERGRLAAHRGGSTVEAASVIKLMFLVAYLRMHRDEPISDADKRILGPMIRESNNAAAEEIEARVGARRVDELARDADMRHFRRSSPYFGLSRISATDWARFMRELDRYVPNRHEDYAKRLLAQIVKRQRWGIAWEAPRGWRLMFKGGWGVGPGKVQNQVALLERGRRRIGLAILTDAGRLTAGYKRQTIAGVTERLLRGLPR